MALRDSVRTSRLLTLFTLLLGLTLWAAPVAQASAAGRTTPALTAYKYNFSRIAWTGSRTVIAATDSHSDLYYFWQASSSPTWHKQLVARGRGRTGYSKPSIAWTGHAVVIATLDAADDLVLFTQKAGHATWSHQRVASSSGDRFHAPSVTAAPGGALLISSAQTGKLLSFERTAGGGAWTRLTAGVGTFGASSITTCYDSHIGGYLAVMTASSGGTLYFWWELLSSPGWNQETIQAAGQGGSFSGGSIVATSTDLLVTAAVTGDGPVGTVEAWVQSIGGSGWTQQIVASSNISTRYANPAIAWTGPVNAGPDSFDVITATNQSGNLVFWWSADADGTWNPETIATAGHHAAYAVPGISATGKAVIITAINTKPGDVLYWHQAYETNPWHEQRVATG